MLLDLFSATVGGVVGYLHVILFFAFKRNETSDQCDRSTTVGERILTSFLSVNYEEVLKHY